MEKVKAGKLATRSPSMKVGTLPVQAKAKKKEVNPDPLLLPDTPTSHYAALLKKNGTGKNSKKNQLLQLLQKGYGNQYTGQVIAGFKDKEKSPAANLVTPVQTKLTAGSANDDYEKEAETVAEKVVAGQRAPSISSIPAGGQKKERRKHPQKPLQKKPLQRREEDGETEEDETPPSTEKAILNKGAGEPIESATRGVLESRMGVDLGDVRVHSDNTAQEAAGELNARAFAYDKDIFLGEGESANDLGLMAHEAAHVVQQTGKTRRRKARLAGNAAARAKAAAPKESAGDVSPGVYDLKGQSKFNPPKTITDWIDKRRRKRGNVNIRFGKVARGTVEVIRYKRKYYIRKKHSIPLNHPLFPGVSDESSSLQPSLVLLPTWHGIKGYIGLKSGKGNPRSSRYLARHLKKTPALIGLTGFDFSKYPKMTNKLEAGSLQVGFSGLNISLGNAFEGTLSLQANDETVTSFEGSAKVNVQGLAEGSLNLKRSDRGDVSGSVKLSLNLPSNFSGGVTINWDKKGITGEGKVGYQGEKLSGDITLKVMEKSKAEQLEEAKKPPPKDAKPPPAKKKKKSGKSNYVVFGDGELTFAFTDWLNGKAQVIVDPKGFVTIIGDITPQAEVILFKKRPYHKTLFKKLRLEWGYGIPYVAKIYIAIFAGASLFASLGPGKFYNISVSGTYSTDPKKCKDFTFKGTFHIQAEAGLSVGVGIEAGLKIAGHRVGAGGEIDAKAGVGGYAEATPILGYREKPGKVGEDKKGEVFIHGDMEIAAQAFLGLGGKLYIKLDSPWWSPAPDKTWNWPLFDKRWPLGKSLGIGASIDHVFGSGKTPDVKFKSVDFSPKKLVKDAVKGRTQRGTGKVKDKKGSWKEKNTRTAAPPKAAAKKGDAQPGKAPAPPKVTTKEKPGRPKRDVKQPPPNARMASGKTVKQLQQEAIKKGKKPEGKGVEGAKATKDAGKKDGTKKTNLELLKKGLSVLDAVTKRYAKDGATKKEVETGVKSVRRKFKVFKSILVVDGGKTWDYKYTVNPTDTKPGPPKAPENKNIEEAKKTKVGDYVNHKMYKLTLMITEVDVEIRKTPLVTAARARSGKADKGKASYLLPYDKYNGVWVRIKEKKPGYRAFTAIGGPGQGGQVTIDDKHLGKGTPANISKSIAAKIGYDTGGKWNQAGHLVAKSLAGPGGYTGGNIVPMTENANLTKSGMPGIEGPVRDDIKKDFAVYVYRAEPVYDDSIQKPPVKIIVNANKKWPEEKNPSVVPTKKVVDNTK